MNKLTFLLPLKDRPNYTKIWLSHNLQPEYDYFIADGSIGNENEALFRELEFPNLTYVRFPKDLTIDRYVEKMLHAVSRVKTKYVMTCDNDDFINFHGVAHCLKALENDPAAVCAGGPIYGVCKSENGILNPRYSFPAKIQEVASLNDRSGIDALMYLFKNYGYMWYSIFRTEDYKKIWNDIINLQVLDVFLIEILQAELTFCYGKYVHVKSNHYIRLLNATTSAAREGISNDIPHTHKIYFDDEYRRQVLKMSEYVAALVEVELVKLLNEFKFIYISNLLTASRIRARLWQLIVRSLIKSIPVLSFSIESVLALINISSRKAVWLDKFKGVRK